MTTQRNPAHPDEEAETGQARGQDPEPARQPAAEPLDEEGDWSGYVVPDSERIEAGWKPASDTSWPSSRPKGPPAESYPALRRAVDASAGPPEDEPQAADQGADDPHPPEGEPGQPAAAGTATDTGPQAAAVAAADPGGAPAPESAGDAAASGGGDEPAADPAATPTPPGGTRSAGAHGRHAAARRSARSSAAPPAAGDSGRDDPDDPDDLAAWVGSLAEADDTAMIAGRRTGSFPAVPAPDTAEEPAAPDTGTVGSTDATPPQGTTSAKAATPPKGTVSAKAAASAEDAPAPKKNEERPGRAEAATGPQRPPAAPEGRPAAQDRADGPGDSGTGQPSRDGAPAAEAPAAPEPAAADPAPAPAPPRDTADDPPAAAPAKAPEPAAATVPGEAESAGDAPPAPAHGPDADASVPAQRDDDREAPAPAAAHDTGDDDDEYQPVTGEFWQPMPAVTREQLIARLDGLATLVGIGRDDFDPEDIGRARHLLDHAGARLRLSGDHTVVALAGGTGSGKSSLFNALSGLEFSRVGITRPTTSAAHACVWGNEGAEGLLGWLGVPKRNRHSRTSELDKDISDLSGLILLDLPDHDSVRSVHTAEADRMIGAADLLVWVLDPQKYADAAVHHRYLAEMSGYGAVTVAVLNQVDRVEHAELEELLTDLRRLLETESGVQPRVLTTSTLTGEGVRALREMLVETVTERRAMIDRLVADLDRVVNAFDGYHGADTAEVAVPADARQRLVAELLEAGGASAIADTAETAHEQRGSRSVGWPLARWARKMRRDPLRVAGVDFLHDSNGTGAPGPVDAQKSEIEKAAADVAEQVSGSLPAPWPRRIRAAA
ncbi:GTPase, partial [Nocardiopsis sediminis]